MNNTIIKNFNKTITYNDDLYLLGDHFLGDIESGLKLFKQLPGNIHLIWGNHDTDAKKEKLKPIICWNVVEILGYASMLKYNNYRFYLSHYPSFTTNFNEYQKPLKKRTLCLAGHTHSKEKFESCNSYNVAVDAHNFFPVSIEQIIEDFKDKFK